MRGAWQLKDRKGPVELYTNVYADVYTNIETGEEYTRGKRKLFECGKDKIPMPPLVEDTERFHFFLYERAATWSAADSLREIMVQGFFKR